MKQLPHFHITKNTPTDPWPRGSWSVYQITGDEIASRIEFDREGIVTDRSSWPGYVGIFETLAEATEKIAALTN